MPRHAPTRTTLLSAAHAGSPVAHFRDVWADDAAFVGARVCSADREDWTALGIIGNDFAAVVRDGLAMSPLARTAVAPDGEPVAIIGMVMGDGSTGVGSPWIVETARAAQFDMDLLPGARDLVEEMHRHCAYLASHVHAENLAKVARFRALGFMFHAAAPLGPIGAPFHLFDRTRSGLPAATNSSPYVS